MAIIIGNTVKEDRCGVCEKDCPSDSTSLYIPACLHTPFCLFVIKGDSYYPKMILFYD